MSGQEMSELTAAEVLAVVAGVHDPELPLSVVDLGLIYGVTLDQGHVTIDMTLTSMGCPCQQMITDDVRDAVDQMAAVESTTVNVVWDPPWTRQRITPQGRKALAEWGITS